MSSDDSDDDFVSYGTPLEPLDEDSLPRKKAFTLEDQVAIDSKGRRRFHGAFTGGFSAGFMNTVGSLEGWTPSEFKSSRSGRAGAKSQRAEDFMDDEDLGEFGIAPKRLTARAEYSGDKDIGRKRPAQNFAEGPIPGVPALEGLLQTVRETVGIKLLKNMGWRPGQGVGPRITKKEKQRMYGCALPPGEEAEDNGSDSDVEQYENVTFAPDDILPYVVTPKKDTFGLGYTGLDRRSVLGTSNVSSDLKMTDRSRKVNIRGQAFGVGAFEEEDEDIYSKEDMSQYDFELGEEASKKKPTHTPGTPGVLEGFVLSKTKLTKKNFPPPSLPKGFIPRHVTQPANQLISPAQAKIPVGLGRHDKNVQTRGLLLGERIPVPSASKNVAEPVKEVLEVKKESQNSCGFQPFKADLDKQRRYELYNALGDKRELANLQPVHMSNWEREREAREFAQAERIFKPLTGVMGDRFTSASQVEDLNNPLAKVQKVQIHGKETQREAAKMKMFGPLTREETTWQPCSLVCKRFNVPEPDTGPSVTTLIPRTSKYSIFDSLDSLAVKEEPPTPVRLTHDEDVAFEESSASVIDVPEVKISVVTPAEEQEPLFADPASKVDLFKAIFLDSSDDDEVVAEEPPKMEIMYDEPIVNKARNKSPPRGLFANLDLDALAARPQVVPPPKPITIDTIPEWNDGKVELPDKDLEYGPKIPDKLMPVKSELLKTDSSSNEDDWVEKSSHSKKEKKNKKHKKHKSRHKKKKNRK